LAESVMGGGYRDADLCEQKEHVHVYMIIDAGSIRVPIGVFDSYRPPPIPSSMESPSSFRAPASTIVLLILLDPYPTKQLRSARGVLLFLLMRLVYVQFRFVRVTSPVGKINHGTLRPFRDTPLCDFNLLAFHCFV
jgi:hypothetical protein